MTITITPGGASPGTSRWTPVVGPRTQEFVRTRTTGERAIPGPAMDTVLEEARSILSRCADPAEPAGRAAVLVVGYVQSGKTLSFTTLASLARDNGYGAVIVIAGTTNNLKDQSRTRLSRDLGMDTLNRDWTELFDNPELGSQAWARMKRAIEAWKRQQSGLTQEEKPALVISMLKHAGRITNAANALRKLPLDGVPVLIVDDESDQAGPNNRAQANRRNGTDLESPTYAAIKALRDALPHHSLVQYTATPQANLLLATSDLLNPDYCQVLTSGPGYTGGQVFFDTRVTDLVKVIDDREIFNLRNPPVEPPEGLQTALKVFLLAIADAFIKGVNENRSMMVQPHQNVDPHTQYRTWINALCEDWQRGLTTGDDYAKQVHDEFRPAYDELSRTVTDLAPFEQVMAGVVERIFDLQVVTVNSTTDAEKNINWTSAHYWILIGGLKLDRGFTVEGLTVTYMPRPVSGNADVLQQRARFFGYRESYIDYCRVYLPRDTIEAFKGYVANEEFLRTSLKAHEGSPLSAWRRDFVLQRQFTQPTRTNVQGRATSRRRSRSKWHWPKAMHLGADTRAENQRLFGAKFSESRNLTFDGDQLPGVVDGRLNSDRNLIRTSVPLAEVLDFLLSVRVATPEDSLLLTTAVLELARLSKDHPATTGAFVFIGELRVAPNSRGRSAQALRTALHVGMSPLGAVGPQVTYSGDAKFYSDGEVTVQLRSLRLTDQPPAGEDYSAVSWLAFRFPTDLTQDYVLDLD